ncbi:polyprotein [Acetobacter malorum]|nr:polyprotein [Acetobacter malorum]
MHANHQPLAPFEQFWIADIGAASHMTSELANLDLSTPYQGTDTITTASGACLQTSNIGASKLVVPQHSLTLKNVLHVSKLSQHLLSIYQLCKDNGCKFIYDDVSFWVQDKSTGKILLKGLCRAGYYPIPFTISQKQSPTPHASHLCFLAKPVNSSIWHKRLGHTSNAITSAILLQSPVPASLDTYSSICTPCLEGKFTKLPFTFPVTKYVQPLEKIHSDVWRPAPLLSYE